VSLRALAVVALLAACGTSKPAPTTPAPTPVHEEKKPVATPAPAPVMTPVDEAGAKLIVFLEEVASVVTAAKGDCDRAAISARIVYERDLKTGDLQTRMKTLMDATPAERSALEARYKDRFEAVDEVMARADERCGKTKSWQDLQRFTASIIGLK
jgi:hypothetical protein